MLVIVMNKEIEDALHTLLHCSLKDTEYETQVEQYKIVRNYITNLQQENQKYKEVIKKLKKWLRLQDILANDKNNPQTVSFKKILEYIEHLERKYNNE